MTRLIARSSISLLCAALVLMVSCAADPVKLAPLARTPPAPDFPENLQWLNVDKPLTMKDLRGKVVLLDFWTFCCINCMHVIPDLKRLETKYGNALAVIGVHTAKFATEKGTDNIRAAILRYEITHPVINDKDFEVWNSYAIRAWPTLVLIDPDGNVVAAHAGEGPYDAFDSTISDLIGQFDAQKKINRTPLTLHLEKDNAPPTPLLFPGKITAGGGKLFVSDSNHNRIVILSGADGTLLDIIGQGAAELKDGSFAQARFSRPQGLALDGDTLYVADTENHAIRKVDLIAKTVATLTSRDQEPAISSPWDLIVHKGILYIAMAGRHQIWSLDLTSGSAAPFAGSGREDISDGSLSEAMLAQPSGLSADQTHLFSADSETSSIRAIDFTPAGQVRTIVGQGLFKFGDHDGPPGAALLQHPLGVLFHDGKLYVADTYNNKIKTIDPVTGQTQTLIGTGQAGFADGPAASAELNEPGGLTFTAGKLYIADTNNHLIRIYDPAAGVLSTLTISQAGRLVPDPQPMRFNGPVITLPAQHVAGGLVNVSLNVAIPSGYKLNAAAPFYLAVNNTPGRNIANPSFPIQTPINLPSGNSNVTIDLIVYYCRSDIESVCQVKRARYVVPVSASSDATSKIVHVDLQLQPSE